MTLFLSAAKKRKKVFNIPVIQNSGGHFNLNEINIQKMISPPEISTFMWNTLNDFVVWAWSSWFLPMFDCPPTALEDCVCLCQWKAGLSANCPMKSWRWSLKVIKENQWWMQRQTQRPNCNPTPVCCTHLMEKCCLTGGGLILEHPLTAWILRVCLKDLDLEEEPGLLPSDCFLSGRNQSRPEWKERTTCAANRYTDFDLWWFKY